MEETAIRDMRWLIMAAVFFMSLGGLWRTVTRLRDATAFGYLGRSVQPLISTVQIIRWVSLLGFVIVLAAYWLRYEFPFGNWIWWAAGIWTLLGIYLTGQGLRILDQIKK